MAERSKALGSGHLILYVLRNIPSLERGEPYLKAMDTVPIQDRARSCQHQSSIPGFDHGPAAGYRNRLVPAGTICSGTYQPLAPKKIRSSVTWTVTIGRLLTSRQLLFFSASDMVRTTVHKILVHHDKTLDAVEEAAAQVNKLLLNDLNAKVKAYPAMDLTQLLQFKLKTYPPLRQAFSQSDSSFAGELPELSTTIIGLNDLISRSDVIWHLGSTAVLGLTPNLVMKVGNDIDVDHLETLEYIRQQNLRIPMPEIHGVLRQSGTARNFVFMSRVPGEPLDLMWKTLSPQQKASVKEQLNAIFTDLRSVPVAPSDEPNAVYGGGKPRRCKDTRRQIRMADAPIGNESEFNRFLSSDPRRTETGNIAMIRSYLGTDHKLVMTHGDLHPRNIMVAFTPCSPDHNRVKGLCLHPSEALGGPDDLPWAQVNITGILDWEMSGWYPEYWEYVKALNTISPGGDFDDWWAYLPTTIGVWPKEHAVDLMLSSWHG
ncbi:aminoglycoside phosphotransferase family protein [Aspergillus ibericus CBS 121593]|uniref:Aminoglycoside phosphotransferase domain-containing protein n=1 Tax=Aspergillus ibericus CBS 121593 TaxID=1448316 RepID=A0A395GVS5_9EURO|nr:hypothetical protein BO80DRAFT_435903 [Aspergillus ibericus CBS 121593]RAK99616.1 hypothetical protein BO80DRAFT_435903 [Aspergillus ibericus CBS 121593]